MSVGNTNPTIRQIVPRKTVIRLLIVWLVVATFSIWGHHWTGTNLTPMVAFAVFAALLATIIGAAFGVVHEADALAHKLGEPYGTLILTLSIVSIEVILIAAVLLGPGHFPTIAKDSIFSVMMIIMNLVIGLSILTGGLKYGEQEYNAQGTMTYLAMIIMLGGISMMLPNFVQGAGGGMLTNTQAISLSAFIIILYGCFLAFQTKGYQHLYVQPLPGAMSIPYQDRKQMAVAASGPEDTHAGGSKSEILVRTLVLLAMILPIVLLSHNMATIVDYGIQAANLPPSLGGVLIAIIVFTPESMTAVKAALNNEFQRTINLCQGAFVSTVGLTIPAVLIIGVITGKQVLLGLTLTETVLFLITLLLSLMTFLGKRTVPFTGIMHLVLFAVFLLLIFHP